jgi:hypothetical protein
MSSASDPRSTQFARDEVLFVNRNQVQLHLSWDHHDADAVSDAAAVTLCAKPSEFQDDCVCGEEGACRCNWTYTFEVSSAGTTTFEQLIGRVVEQSAQIGRCERCDRVCTLAGDAKDCASCFIQARVDAGLECLGNCNVCYESITVTNRTPMPCAHMLCTRCSERITCTSATRRCPLCRRHY